jgi:hypothetical protein
MAAVKTAVISFVVICFDQRVLCVRHPIDPQRKKHRMNEHTKRPTMTDAEVRKELMNDSLGTIDTADFTGSDETNLPQYFPIFGWRPFMSIAASLDTTASRLSRSDARHRSS